MEFFQKEIIKSNLSFLLSNTIVTAEVLAILQEESAFSDYDVESIRAENTNYEKAYMLYTIIQTKANGYVSLLKALKLTNSGAYKILSRISPEMISTLVVSRHEKLTTVMDLLDANQMAIMSDRLNDSVSTEDRIEMYETIFNKANCRHLIRNTIPDEYPLYIPRFLSRRTVINPELFLEPCEDVFVLKNISYIQLRKFIIPNNIESSTSQVLQTKITARFILLDISTDWERICAKLQGTSAHLLKYEETTQTFLLEKSSNLSTELRAFLCNASNHNNRFSENLFVETVLKENVKGVCICDVPGMGKSLLLASIARKIRHTCQNSIVLFIELRNLELPAEPLLRENILQTILIYASSSRWSGHILFELVKIGNVSLELFFDGLDEVDDSKLQSATIFLKTVCQTMPRARIFVTSRQVVRTELENSIGVIAYDILPFDEDTQLEYLTSSWLTRDASCMKERLLNYGRMCLEKFKLGLREGEADIAGIPLQCKLIAEVYLEQATAFADKHRSNPPDLSTNFPNSLTEIYSKYMKRQFGEARCNFNCKNYDFVSTGTLCKYPACQVKAFHIWKSLQLIFPVLSAQFSPITCTELENLNFQKKLYPGLMTKHAETRNCKDMEFVHRTFAEFLVAEYFVSTIFKQAPDSEQQRNFQQLAFNQLFTSGKCEYNTFTAWKAYRYKLREEVVAYFTEALLGEYKNGNVESVTCKAEQYLSNQFLHTLVGCMNKDSTELVHIYLKAAKNSCEVKAPSKQAVKDFNKEDLALVLMIATELLSTETVKKICNFFLANYRIDLIRTAYSYHTETVIQIPIELGDYEMAKYLDESFAFPIQISLFFCVVGTYFQSQHVLEKKLAIADMLLKKCPNYFHDSNNFRNNESPVWAREIHVAALKLLADNGASICVSNRAGAKLIYYAAKYMSDESFVDLCYLYNEKNLLHYFLMPKTLSNYFLCARESNQHMTKLIIKFLKYLKVATSCEGRLTEGMIRENAIVEDPSPDESLRTILNEQFYTEHSKLFSVLFHASVFEDFLKVTDLLLCFDPSLVDINVELDEKPVPILFLAENIEMVKFLVSKGANVFDVDIEGRTLLHMMAKTLQSKDFFELLKLVGTFWGRVPRHQSWRNRFTESIELEKPANVIELLNWRTKTFKKTVLHCAIYHFADLFSGRFEDPTSSKRKLDLLLSGGRSSDSEMVLNINAVDADGNSALHMALRWNRHLRIIQNLVIRGADIQRKLPTGCNVLHICAQERLPYHLMYFLENKEINVNEVDHNGNNALQCGLVHFSKHSYCYNLDEIITILLDAGASKMHRNSENKTAYDIAKQRKFPEAILKMLKDDIGQSNEESLDS